jgi:tetratricopeptide (TPR) repeat protein
MKSKYVILASALLISVTTFAQKDETKAAEKALKKGDSKEAATILKGAESLIASSNEADKAQFFFVKGNTYLDLANKKVEVDTNLAVAAAAYQDLIAAEKASGKVKYSTQAAASITEIKYLLINSAIADSKVEKNAEGAKKLYDAYLLDKKDTLNLYYAASTYVNANDYDKALAAYYELRDLNFSGQETIYTATNKASGAEDPFKTAAERNRMVTLGTHENPKTEVVPSKRGEIFKNISLILVQNGKTEEAKKAIAEARIANPDDNSLSLTEANLYLESKDFVRYKELITKVIEKNPNDADLVFNLGVISANANDEVNAEKYYLKAIEINPKYINAYINLSALKLEKEKPIIDEMNKLGTSDKDMKRYEALKKERSAVFKGVIPYLEKAFDVDPKNEAVSSTLSSVYSALEMSAEKKALQARIQK